MKKKRNPNPNLTAIAYLNNPKEVKEVNTSCWNEVAVKHHSLRVELNVSYENDDDNFEYLEIDIKMLKIEKIY